MSVDPDKAATRDPADAKAWFYLDNRSDIEEWAGLRAAGRDLLDGYLVDMAVEVEAMAAQESAELYARDLDAGGFPRAGLRKPTWTCDGVPDVAVIVEWERSRLLGPGANSWPYVAVRVSPSQKDEQRRRSVFNAIEPLRQRLRYEKSRKVTEQWAMWQYVKSPLAQPVDPAELATLCLSTLRDVWREAAPLIDQLQPPADQV